MNTRALKKRNGHFQDLFNSDCVQKISDGNMRTITGGDPSPTEIAALIANLFTNSPVFVQVAGLSSPQWTDFKNQVEALATTNVGYDLLSKLDAENKQISISPVDPFPNAIGGAEFDDSPSPTPGGVIYVGSLDLNYLATTAAGYYSLVADNFDVIAHELYHAYDYIKNGTKNTPNAEPNAFLFGFMACAEMDEKRGITASNMWSNNQNVSYVQNQINRDATIWNYNGSQTQQNLIDEYKNAVYEMFHNKDFSLTNYNKYIELFLSTSAVGYGSNIGTVTQTTFNNSIIENFWAESYSQSSYFNTYNALFQFADPIPNNSGGSGGGGNDPNNPYGFSFFDFYNQMQNTGNNNNSWTITVSDWVLDSNNNWKYMPGGSTTFDGYYSYNMGDFYNAWFDGNSGGDWWDNWNGGGANGWGFSY